MKIYRVVCDWQRCGKEITEHFHHRVAVWSVRSPSQERGQEVSMDACSQECALELVGHYFKNDGIATVHVHKPRTVAKGVTP